MASFGDQLMLPFEGELDTKRIPWGGRSPRALTRVHLGLIFKPQGGKSVSDSVDPAQYDLWLTVKKAPWKYQGAPLLQELGRSALELPLED